ncbi:DMT family transporter [Devosia sp.]|uniref:DMT family transporter n=1 Tax=Devosia sp. TaxID=1871048 RepID=UPI003BA916AA
MNQISSASRNGALTGALLMIFASLAFAGTNILQNVLIWPIGMSSTGMTFWQYLIATVIAVPLIFRLGVNKLRTRHPVLHEIRAFVSALGVHVFVYAFASGMPAWQVVTLLATGPLFIILASTLFLGEKASPARLFASLLGFVGALMVSGIGSDGFSAMVLIPIAAAALWATTDVLTKYLSREESPETLTVSLLVLITPNHLLILLVATLLSTLTPGLLPAGVATGFPFQLPEGGSLWLLGLLGVLTAAAQYLLASAYKVADATYLQPFGDLKVPLTAVIGFIFLAQVPTFWFWIGAALIVAASSFIYWSENGKHDAPMGLSAA